MATKRDLATRRRASLGVVAGRLRLRDRSQASVPAPDLALATRGARRKHRTRERLLDAALSVFVKRGYDGATTTEMAKVADLGVGTFYCHFRDKRAAFEGLAHRASRTMLERWTGALGPAATLDDGVALGLETATAFWREDLDRARLLLEDGPSFGTAAHVRLLDEVATMLRARCRARGGTALRPPQARALAVLAVGLGVELGRIVLGSGQKDATAVIASTIALARGATASSRPT